MLQRAVEHGKKAVGKFAHVFVIGTQLYQYPLHSLQFLAHITYLKVKGLSYSYKVCTSKYDGTLLGEPDPLV